MGFRYRRTSRSWTPPVLAGDNRRGAFRIRTCGTWGRGLRSFANRGTLFSARSCCRYGDTRRHLGHDCRVPTEAIPGRFQSDELRTVIAFLVCAGTIAFPVITAVTLGTDLPSLWALQGLFLFGVLIVTITRKIVYLVR